MGFNVGMFWNLASSDPEKTARLASFKSALLSVPDPNGQLPGTSFNVQHADGDFLDPNEQNTYKKRSQKLIGSDIYVASCQPTFEWLSQLPTTTPPTKIVIAGMFFPWPWLPNGGQRYAGAYGYASYDITMVSRWVALLANVFNAINPNQTCTQIGVLIDSRQGPHQNEAAAAICKAITQQASPVGVQQFAIENGPDHILPQLEQFKSDYPAGGLIIPAATLTAINRQKLINNINNVIKLPTIYPNALYVRSGGLISIGADLSEDLNALYGAAGTLAGKILLKDSSVSPGLQLWPASSLITELNSGTASTAMGYTASQIAELVKLANVVI